MKKLLALITLAVCAATSSFGYLQSANNTSPSFNSPFVTIEPNIPVNVTYSISISCSSSVSGTVSGTVFLEQSVDGTTWSEISRITNTQTVGLVLGVSITDTKVMVLSGTTQPNYYVRLRTATTGSPTITLITGYEAAFT